ncbi:MAG TPA: outer membrane protein OmpK [Burkholderiaceae bacterium]|nr:outer membrane protein OmpK [Burkholderiaceae bacterium]
MKLRKWCKAAAGVAVAVSTVAPAAAADWSDTEVLFNYGTKFREPFNPFAAKDPNKPWQNDTDVTKYYLTLQHASGHKLGRNFFFVDILNSTKNDPPGPSGHGEIYSEGYTSLSLSKLTGATLSFGPVADVNLTAGYNYGAKSNGANPRVFLAGVTVDFKVPGFIFFNVDVLSYNDKGRFAGGPSINDTTYQITPVWLSKFSLGPTNWVFTGHVDFIGKRCPATGSCDGRKTEILAQPELRMDVGQFVGKKETVYLGIKYNWWRNKFGFDGLNESNPQLQLDWKL